MSVNLPVKKIVYRVWKNKRRMPKMEKMKPINLKALQKQVKKRMLIIEN